MKSLFKRHEMSLQEVLEKSLQDTPESYGYAKAAVCRAGVDPSILQGFSAETIMMYWLTREESAAQRVGNIAIRIEKS